MLVSYINFFHQGVYLRVPMTSVCDGEFMKADLFSLHFSGATKQ